VLFVLLTLFSMVFSSSLQCATWRDRIEGVALLAVVYVLLTPALGQLAAFLSARLTAALLHSGKVRLCVHSMS
jgi:cation transporter-like permease